MDIEQWALLVQQEAKGVRKGHNRYVHLALFELHQQKRMQNQLFRHLLQYGTGKACPCDVTLLW